jgi:hypothetical protein
VGNVGPSVDDIRQKDGSCKPRNHRKASNNLLDE